jgi:hypothetical protein
VAAKFPDYTGRYMIHCHMLDHEDHGMMTQFEVVGPGGLGVPPDPGASPAPRGPRSALGLPSNKRCRPSQSFTFQVRPPRGLRLKRALIYVNGHLVARLGRTQLAHRLSLTNLPPRRFMVKIVARTTSGKRLAASRQYRVCRNSHANPRAAQRTTNSAAIFECHLAVVGTPD